MILAETIGWPDAFVYVSLMVVGAAVLITMIRHS